MPSNNVAPSRRIAIGIIRKAIGLQGICAVEAMGNSLEKLELPVDVFVGASESAVAPMILEHIEIRKKGPVCGFSGISDAESATGLRDLFIYIDAASLPELNDDAYYHFELVGLKVQDDCGNEIGSIIAVHNFPTVDSIEVTTKKADTLMIPLTADAVVEVDRKSGYMTVRQSFIEDLY